MAQKKKPTNYQDCDVFKQSFNAAISIYDLSKKFPLEEVNFLTDQILRASTSVCANFAEAWSKRRYRKAFVAKLTDCEAEAGEVLVWLKFAIKFDLLTIEDGEKLEKVYNHITNILANMINNPESWLIK